MEDLSLHILDLAENAVRAGAATISITIEEDIGKDLMSITIEDDGKGMEPDILKNAFDPFVTTKETKRVGLGLSLFEEAAKMAGGSATIESSPGRGAKVTATFRHGHIDRKPLGDIIQTLIALIAGYPEVEIRYLHRKDGKQFILDTRELRSHLDGFPINHPEVLKFIREALQKGLRGILDTAPKEQDHGKDHRNHHNAT